MSHVPVRVACILAIAALTWCGNDTTEPAATETETGDTVTDTVDVAAPETDAPETTGETPTEPSGSDPAPGATPAELCEAPILYVNAALAELEPDRAPFVIASDETFDWDYVHHPDEKA